jgi:NTP pyrophosphatase (non-canonical NTP hydrolase)
MRRSENGSHHFVDLLVELQREVKTVERDRGTSHERTEQKALILAEEVFEVLKTLRYRSGVATSTRRQSSMLDDELADVLFVTAAMANRVPISLKEAFDVCSEDDSWFIGAKKTAAGSAQDVVLQLALSIAAEVLTVLTLVNQAESKNCEEGLSCGSVPVSEERDLVISLGRVTVLVGALADRDSIDLSQAMSKKLKKDQLRLWSAIGG